MHAAAYVMSQDGDRRAEGIPENQGHNSSWNTNGSTWCVLNSWVISEKLSLSHGCLIITMFYMLYSKILYSKVLFYRHKLESHVYNSCIY